MDQELGLDWIESWSCTGPL